MHQPAKHISDHKWDQPLGLNFSWWVWLRDWSVDLINSGSVDLTGGRFLLDLISRTVRMYPWYLFPTRRTGQARNRGGLLSRKCSRMSTLPRGTIFERKFHVNQPSNFRGYSSVFVGVFWERLISFFGGLRVKCGTDVGFHFRMLQGYKHTWWWMVISFACLRFSSKTIRQHPATMMKRTHPSSTGYCTETCHCGQNHLDFEWEGDCSEPSLFSSSSSLQHFQITGYLYLSQECFDFPSLFLCIFCRLPKPCNSA